MRWRVEYIIVKPVCVSVSHLNFVQTQTVHNSANMELLHPITTLQTSC